MAKSDAKTGKNVARDDQQRPARMLSPFDDMDRFFDAFFPRTMLSPMRLEWPRWDDKAFADGHMPKVDVIDRDDQLLVRAELPGVDKKDVDIALNDNAVQIKATTKKEHREEKGDYHRCEIRQGSFSRTVPLPAEVDTESAKASFNDGILELVLKKQERARKRSVKIE